MVKVEVSLADFNRATQWWFEHKPEAIDAGADHLAFFLTKELAEHLGIQETKVERFRMTPVSELPKRKPQPQPRVAPKKAKADPAAVALFDDVIKSLGSVEW